MAASAPATMNAIYYDQYGEFDAVLKQGQLPVPQPKPDEVQVHVRAASLNPVDWKFTKGYLKNWIPKTFPAVPGFDVSGVVSAVGADVHGFKVGDEVYGDGGFEGSGSLAEFVVLPASCLSHKPKSLSWEDAASIPLTFLTSYQALVDTAKQKAGAKVVILGGSGGCGTAAIQIAKALGAWVATTTSAANTEFVKSLGADVAIDYTSKKWEEELKGTEIDIVYDTVGTEGSWESALTLLKKGGAFVGIAGPRKESTADHSHAIIITVAKKGSEQLPVAEKLIAEGKYKPLVNQVFAFTQAQAIEMFNKSASSRTTGKLVMKVQA